MHLKGSHFLSVEQIHTLADLEEIFNRAAQLEVYAARKKKTRVLEGAILANLFFEPSTRTRFSFAAAFYLLGGNVMEMTDTKGTSLSKGESIYDMSQTISAYADIMVVRHPEGKAVSEFAQAAKISVINAGDGIGEHPTQALLDVYTLIKRKGHNDIAQLKNITITLVGDLKHGRTVHSLCKLLSLMERMHFKFVSPSGLEMPSTIINLLKQRGHTVEETADFQKAAADSDVIYTTRIQEERFSSPEVFMKHANLYSLDLAFYQTYCKKHPFIMHPLPRNSRLTQPEIHNNMNSHPNLLIFEQIANGVPIRMALFSLILGADFLNC